MSFSNLLAYPVALVQRLIAVDIDAMLSDADASTGSLAGLDTALDTYGKGGFSLVQKGGVYIAVIFMVGLGIMFVVHAGNAQKTAETKSSVVPRVIGIVLIFGAVAIVGVLQSIGAQLF